MWALTNKKDFLSFVHASDGREIYVNKLTTSFIFDDNGVKINLAGGDKFYVKFEDIETINGSAASVSTLQTMFRERITATGKPISTETLSVSTTAVRLASIPSGANYALITVEGDSVRYWLDGTAPTVSEGMKRVDGDTIDLASELDISGFKVISAGTSTLQVQYFG